MLLEIEGLSYSYDKHHEALKDVTVTFGPGMHLLLGPNGAGKSTLLSVIDGRLRPQDGDCVLGREATVYHSPHALKEIFFLSDNLLFPLDSINDMARLQAPFYPSFSIDFLRDSLEAFGLKGDEPIRELSLGNRRKAQIAYAISLGTKILLLDEPANGLDITSKKTLATLLSRAMDIDPERTVIVATHTVQELRNLFDTVTILDKGHVVINATVARIAERLAFVRDPRRHGDAIVYEPAIDGPTQIIPNTDGLETQVDFSLLFTASIGQNSETLKSLLS